MPASGPYRNPSALHSHFRLVVATLRWAVGTPRKPCPVALARVHFHSQQWLFRTSSLRKLPPSSAGDPGRHLCFLLPHLYNLQAKPQLHFLPGPDIPSLKLDHHQLLASTLFHLLCERPSSPEEFLLLNVETRLDFLYCDQKHFLIIDLFSVPTKPIALLYFHFPTFPVTARPTTWFLSSP